MIGRRSRMATLSIRARLTLWYSAVLLVVLSAWGFGVYAFQVTSAFDRFDADLERSAQIVAATIAQELEEEDELQLSDIVAEELDELDVPGRSVIVFDGISAVVGARWKELDPAHAPELARSSESVFTLDTSEYGGWRVFVLASLHADTVYRVMVAEPLTPITTDLANLRRILAGGIPLALLLAAAGGWSIARRGLTPLTRLTAEIQQMTGDGPELRLTVPETSDELTTLARNFNALLGRLDAALQRQRQFMADASHELRTPVSVIRNAADVTLGRDNRAGGEYRESIGVIREQGVRLSRLVENMFLLAQADAGGRPIVRTRFYLDDLLDECIRGMQVLADPKHLHLCSQGERDLEIEADEDLVRQMLVNLLDNAVRHTPPHGSVEVTLAGHEEVVELRVTDTGPGIASGDRERIFRRFVRLDAARGKSVSGGLGLPIARWAAEAHGGALDLHESRGGGATFVARLPRGRREERKNTVIDPS